MKQNSFIIIVAVLTISTSCNSNTAAKKESEQKDATASNSTQATQNNGIVGEWEQQYTCYDKNGNYTLEPDEKIPSNTRLGFNWFKFKADGSCLRDKDVQFEGTYSIEEKDGSKKLTIQGGDNLRYTIAGLTEKELILGADGAFIVFKRIK